MNIKIPSKYLSFGGKLARFVVCEAAALLISFFLIIAIAYTAVSMVSDSPPYEIEEESIADISFLGLIGAAFLSLPISLTLAVLAHVYIFNKFPIKIPSKYSLFFKKLARLIICEIWAFYVSVFSIFLCPLWFSIPLTVLFQICIFKKFYIRKNRL
ncbi:MAG: hypothetical protein LBL05_00990 [Synergistaceae bacterium]|nr:hypothetical protein [Synergistaceae bacterium]